MNQRVFTRFGQGTVIAQFQDGTYCVRLDSGGGVILLPHEILNVTCISASSNEAVYAMAG